MRALGPRVMSSCFILRGGKAITDSFIDRQKNGTAWGFHKGAFRNTLLKWDFIFMLFDSKCAVKR